MSEKNTSEDTVEVNISRNTILGLVAVIAVAAAAFAGYQYGISSTPVATVPETTQPLEEAVEEDALVSLTILNDEACSVCDTSQIVASLSDLFANLDVTTVDITSPEGKVLAAELEAKSVPAYFFDSNVAESESYSNIQQYLDETSDGFVLRVGGDKKLIGRTESEVPTVDLFVMSQCPYGTMGEDNMVEVLDNFGDAISANIWFIASESGDGFSSLHGQPEVDENLRQVCVMEYAPEKIWDYLSCVNKDIVNVESEWEQCAIDAGINPNNIRDCAEGEEGADLLRENIQFADELGITGSPGFLINNQVLASGLRTSEQIKQMLCGASPSLEGCENVLSSDSTVSGSC